MLKNYIYQNYTYIIVVSLYSFFINYYFANFGALPIDTFAFFDTGYNILEGRHPFKDYWVTTGPFVDYFQSLFFLIFGKSWSSYVIHGSFLNFFISISFYITLTKLSLNKNYSLIYSIVFATLAYTISGTPFAYIHSYIFSLFAILLFAICVNTNSKKGFLILPIILILSFLSMQNPSTFIIFLTVIGSFIFFYKFNQLGLFLYFALGSIIGIVLFFLFFLITGINISDFIQQYILFPLSIGTNRVTDSNLAHFGISDRLTIRGTIGHFKFIHLYLLSIFFITIYFFKKKLISNEFLFINIIIILSGICFIFNQLITSNQTYIFSFIPFAAAFLHISLMKKLFFIIYSNNDFSEISLRL